MIVEEGGGGGGVSQDWFRADSVVMGWINLDGC